MIYQKHHLAYKEDWLEILPVIHIFDFAENILRYGQLILREFTIELFQQDHVQRAAYWRQILRPPLFHYIQRPYFLQHSFLPSSLAFTMLCIRWKLLLLLPWLFYSSLFSPLLASFTMHSMLGLFPSLMSGCWTVVSFLCLGSVSYTHLTLPTKRIV